MRAFIVLNPRARLAAASAAADTIVATLRGLGVTADLYVSASEEDARQAAQAATREGYDTVIAAGGDGTVNSVIEAVAGQRAALGVVPLGTANVVGGWAGIQTGDIAGACSVIAAGKTRTVDLGCLNGRHFLAMAGIGLDAQVAARVHSGWKQVVGRHAFVGRFLTTVLHESPRRFRVRVGQEAEQELSLWGVIVCNGPQYTWRLRLVPEAIDDDGRLDIVMLQQCGRLALLRLAYDLFVTGRPARGHRHVTVTRSHELIVDCDTPVPWQTDGDVGGVTPAHITVLPGGLKLIVR